MTRVRQSEWRRRWGIMGITTFEGQAAVSGDDGYTGDDSFFDSSNLAHYLGEFGGVVYDLFARIPNVTIPGGATIQVAHFTRVEFNSQGAGTGDTLIAMEDADDAIAPTTRAEHAADVRTTASTAWDNIGGTDLQSPSIVDVVQEVVDRGSWASGNAMMLLWDDNASPAGQLIGSKAQDDATDPALILHVEYGG